MKIDKKCPMCGASFSVKPSHSWRVYCSVPCRAIASKKRGMFPCPDCGKLMDRQLCEISKPCSDCFHKRLSAIHKKSGYSPHKVATAESEARRFRAFSTDEFAEKTRILHAGKIKRSDLTRRFSEKHSKAIPFSIRSPRGVVYVGKGIRKFVHEHEHLFDSVDVEWMTGKYGLPTSCRASNGLSSLFKLEGTRLSWKGWTRGVVDFHAQSGIIANSLDETKARSVFKARSPVQSGGSRNADGGRSCQS